MTYKPRGVSEDAGSTLSTTAPVEKTSIVKEQIPKALKYVGGLAQGAAGLLSDKGGRSYANTGEKRNIGEYFPAGSPANKGTASPANRGKEVGTPFRNPDTSPVIPKSTTPVLSGTGGETTNTARQQTAVNADNIKFLAGAGKAGTGSSKFNLAGEEQKVMGGSGIGKDAVPSVVIPNKSKYAGYPLGDTEIPETVSASVIPRALEREGLETQTGLPIGSERDALREFMSPSAVAADRPVGGTAIKPPATVEEMNKVQNMFFTDPEYRAKSLEALKERFAAVKELMGDDSFVRERYGNKTGALLERDTTGQGVFAAKLLESEATNAYNKGELGYNEYLTQVQAIRDEVTKELGVKEASRLEEEKLSRDERVRKAKIEEELGKYRTMKEEDLYVPRGGEPKGQEQKEVDKAKQADTFLASIAKNNPTYMQDMHQTLAEDPESAEFQDTWAAEQQAIRGTEETVRFSQWMKEKREAAKNIQAGGTGNTVADKLTPRQRALELERQEQGR